MQGGGDVEFDSGPTRELLKAWIKERDAKGGSIIHEWTEYVQQSGLILNDLSQVSTANKPYHMALYVRFLFIEKGLRAEQVGQAIARVKGLFWKEVWPDADLWNHPLVDRVVGLSFERDEPGTEGRHRSEGQPREVQSGDGHVPGSPLPVGSAQDRMGRGELQG